MNPVLPGNFCIPDPEAHVWADGRLYIYGSRDIPGSPEYCSPTHSVFSSDNLIHWKDHDTAFDSKDCGMYAHPILSAPDCGCKDGTYYLYFCINEDGGREGVAVSDTPWGLFGEASPVEGADFGGIDPAVLVDDDGEAYLFWGQFELKAARLCPDMRSIDTETYIPDLLTERAHGFHEGSCIRKVEGRYYLIFADISRGLATCLSYAVADHPLGPYEKKGVIIDNVHCDPRSWNNHGSIECFKGHWYIFYHRSSQNSFTSRRACIEPIEILPDGSIPEVEMTTQGVEDPLGAGIQIEAWRACLLYGIVHTKVADEVEYLSFEKAGDFAAFKYFNFSGQNTVHLRLRGKGRLRLALGQSWETPIAEIEVESSDQWSEHSIPLVQPAKGIHAVYLVHADGLLDVASFRFS